MFSKFLRRRPLPLWRLISTLHGDAVIGVPKLLHSTERNVLTRTRELQTRTIAGTVKSSITLPEAANSYVGLTGGEVFHKMMVRHGVKHIFGIPGGAIMPVFDAIYDAKEYKFILVKHEQNAGHMAEGYARVSAKPGIVLVTSGPGVTNVITALQDAKTDGTPIIVFCGQVPTTARGTDAFQEADILGMSKNCTKWNAVVENVNDLPSIIDNAFEIATSGRPGPVLIDLPKDITESVVRDTPMIQSDLLLQPSPAATIAEDLFKTNLKDRLARVATLINSARQPVIYAGQGVMSNSAGPTLLKELADKANIPVTTTMQGLGAFDETDPKALHMLGMHGSAYANLAIQEADLIIALGARFDDRVTGDLSKFAPKARQAAAENRGGIVHFEILRSNINKVVRATEFVEGDLTMTLPELIPMIDRVEDRSMWMTQIETWKREFPLGSEVHEMLNLDHHISPQKFIKVLSALTDHDKENTIITTGVGQHQMWVAQHFGWRFPRTWVGSGGMGTMGFGLPSAIGAKLARPGALVIDVDGDGSFNMSCIELSTACQFDIGVKIIILNNNEHGMVTQWQSLFYGNRFSGAHQQNPDFCLLSEAMGLPARKCTKMVDVEKDLKWLLKECGNGPALLEVMIKSKQHVLPMVASGKGLDEMIV